MTECNRNATLQGQANGTVNVQEVESRIHALTVQMMELVQQSTANSSVGENLSRLHAMSDEIKALSDMLAEYKQSCGSVDTIESRIAQITEILEKEPDHSDTYNDALVRQLIDTIKVMGEDRLEIHFMCGLRYEQAISLKVRKLNAAS